jgi:hypothetical protein
MQQALIDMQIMDHPVDVTQVYTNSFLAPPAAQ